MSKRTKPLLRYTALLRSETQAAAGVHRRAGADGYGGCYIQARVGRKRLSLYRPVKGPPAPYQHASPKKVQGPMAELGALPIDRSRLALPPVAWSGRRFETRFPTPKARLSAGPSYSMTQNSNPLARPRPFPFLSYIPHASGLEILSNR